jgi:hypothetical protein
VLAEAAAAALLALVLPSPVLTGHDGFRYCMLLGLQEVALIQLLIRPRGRHALRHSLWMLGSPVLRPLRPSSFKVLWSGLVYYRGRQMPLRVRS